MHLGPRGNKLPYVYTNPSKESELFRCDKVFVLCPESPHERDRSITGVVDDLVMRGRVEKSSEMAGDAQALLEGQNVEMSTQLRFLIKNQQDSHNEMAELRKQMTDAMSMISKTK